MEIPIAQLEEFKAHYNPQFYTTDELVEDIAVFVQVKKSTTRYVNSGAINSRRMVNNLIVLMNVFEPNFIKSLFQIELTPEKFVVVNTHLYYMDRTYDIVDVDKVLLNIIREQLG